MAFWCEHVGPQGLRSGKDPAEAFDAAFEQYVRVQTSHSANSTLCQQYFTSAKKLAAEAGLADLAPSLTTGIGDTFDTRSMARLWQVSRNQATMEDYLAEFGFQTSAGDDFSASSWRENPVAIQSLVESYRKMDDSASPFAHEHSRAEHRRMAEQQIIAALPAERRDAARQSLDLLVSSTRVRELGKASYRIALDVARAAARAQGVALHCKGRIASPDDVFLLTHKEAFGNTGELRELVDQRRLIEQRYATYDMPQAWTGLAEPVIIGELEDEQGAVSGLGVSAGVIEGPVRLILDHASAEDMEPGEVLVTNTTDPSWGPFFVVAGALVIDVGGAMSHGAIIARELGIPCVINTKNGTRRLKDGMIVRVDGKAGTVEVLR
jgi:pyruvate,water dikinase